MSDIYKLKMDDVQVMAFLRPLLDTKGVGGDSEGNEYVGEPVCPELFSLLRGLLGNDCPEAAWYAVHTGDPVPDNKRYDDLYRLRVRRANRLAAFLRDVADALTKEQEP